MSDLAVILSSNLEDGLDQALEVYIPDDVDLDNFIAGITCLGGEHQKTERKRSVELAFMGRSLHVAQLRRKELKEKYGLGIGDVERIITGGGPGHSSIYKAALFYRLYPGRSPMEYAKIGSEKFRIASYAAKRPGLTQVQRNKYLDIAVAATTVEEAREKMEVFVGEGITQSSSLTLYGDHGEISSIKELCRDLRSRVPGENRKDPNTGVVLAALESFSAEPFPMTANGDGSYHLTEEVIIDGLRHSPVLEEEPPF